MGFATIFALCLVLVLVSAWIIVQLEPDTFPTYFEAVWWVMTTVVTVGYGDVSPVTTMGKAYTMIFLYIFGIGFVGVLIGKTVDSLSSYQRMKEAGKLSYSGTRHYIMIGSITKVRNAVREILEVLPHAQFVYIGAVERNPLLEDRVHYIHGDASDEEILFKANILDCNSVSIFADDEMADSVYADGKSLLIASAVEGLSKQHGTGIYTIVEVMKENHISKFKHANVDEFILSNEAVSRLVAQASLHHGSSELFRQLTSKAHGDNVYEIAVKPSWYTYKDAFLELLEQGATLISDRNQLDINRRLDQPIPADARLFIVCDENTYKKIKG